MHRMNIAAFIAALPRIEADLSVPTRSFTPTNLQPIRASIDYEAGEPVRTPLQDPPCAPAMASCVHTATTTMAPDRLARIPFDKILQRSIGQTTPRTSAQLRNQLMVSFITAALADSPPRIVLSDVSWRQYPQNISTHERKFSNNTSARISHESILWVQHTTKLRLATTSAPVSMVIAPMVPGLLRPYSIDL
ncbi:hypothetical protein SUNI508_12570 [Seiridium unicorne]|uniref:Uncharacterized protein n=1 Tax=Seiridium unicorne TaxID=138068 RepID=A0ABR2VHY9_9PEZI